MVIMKKTMFVCACATALAASAAVPFKNGVNASKYSSWGVDKEGKPQMWGMIPVGRILLQDHSDSTVSFCNLKVKELR